MGRFKARFFAALGFTADNWRDFETALRAQHLSHPAVAGPVDALGQFFTMRAILKVSAGAALVTSVWFLFTGSSAAIWARWSKRAGQTRLRSSSWRPQGVRRPWSHWQRETFVRSATTT